MTGNSKTNKCDGTYDLNLNQHNGSPLYEKDDRVLVKYEDDNWGCVEASKSLPAISYFIKSKYISISMFSYKKYIMYLPTMPKDSGLYLAWHILVLGWPTITVIYTEKPSADFSAKTITKTAEGFFWMGSL